MSQYDDDEYGEFDDESNNMRDLRRALKKAQKENAAIKQQAEEALGALRERSVKDALTSQGLNPKIAAFIPRDVAADQIDGWLKEYGDVFGVAPQAPAPDGGQATGQPAPPATYSEADLAALNAIEGAAVGGVQAGSAGDVASKIAGATTEAELTALLRSL
jgi:hypothetical protein